MDGLMLLGVVGSRAYGLDHTGSDTDRLGVYQAPTRYFLGLLPEGKAEPATIATNNPDRTLYELGKFCRLALACNPTVIELLWLDAYDERSWNGDWLIGLRSAFLSERARPRYFRYARDQLASITPYGDHPPPKVSKRIRHAARLLEQGEHLLRTGELRVRCGDPEALNWLAQQPYPVMLDEMIARLDRFDEAPCVLPAEPDRDLINDTLITIRETAL